MSAQIQTISRLSDTLEKTVEAQILLSVLMRYNDPQMAADLRRLRDFQSRCAESGADWTRVWVDGVRLEFRAFQS